MDDFSSEGSIPAIKCLETYYSLGIQHKIFIVADTWIGQGALKIEFDDMAVYLTGSLCRDGGARNFEVIF